MEELELDSKDNGDPLGSIWQESDMTKTAFWKTLSSSRVENALGWRRVNLKAGAPLGGSWRPRIRGCWLEAAQGRSVSGWEADEGWCQAVLLKGLVCSKIPTLH